MVPKLRRVWDVRKDQKRLKSEVVHTSELHPRPENIDHSDQITIPYPDGSVISSLFTPERFRWVSREFHQRRFRRYAPSRALRPSVPKIRSPSLRATTCLDPAKNETRWPTDGE